MGAKTSAARALGTAVKVVATGADLVVRPVPGLVILIYHRVGGGSGSNVDLPLGTFEAQVASLAGDGRIVTLDEGVRRIEAGEAVDGAVVLSFDDGTPDWVEHVLPVLERHRAPATFYVATEYVDRSRSFPWGAPPISWSALRELTASGLAVVGSHTHSHALLDRVDATTAASELDRSIELIGEHLGVRCEHFAYPKALLGSPPAEAEVRARFRSATVAGTRANPPHADVHRLHRTPIQATDGLRWFRRKVEGGLRAEDSARQLVNRVRYAGAAR